MPSYPIDNIEFVSSHRIVVYSPRFVCANTYHNSASFSTDFRICPKRSVRRLLVLQAMAADRLPYSEGIDQSENGPQNGLLPLPHSVFGSNSIINPRCNREGHVPSFDDPASECKAVIASDSRSRYRPEFEFAS